MTEGGHCALCAKARTVLLAIVLGAGAGFAVIEVGGSSDLSMAATFFGALAPVLWHLRENRSREGDSR